MNSRQRRIKKRLITMTQNNISVAMGKFSLSTNEAAKNLILAASIFISLYCYSIFKAEI